MLVIAVLAMLLPGTDPVTMLISMAPLYVLFELSLVLARRFGRPPARIGGWSAASSGSQLAASLLVPAGAGAAVLYVGDSLGVGTGPYLREQLGGEAMSLDAEVGRPSSVGVGDPAVEDLGG